MSCLRYDIQMNIAPRENVRLLYISKSRFGGDWRSVPHTHSCTELFYCIRGKGQFNIAGNLYHVKQDDLVMVNPRTEHTELSLDSSPLEYMVLGIEGVEFLLGQKNHGYALLSCEKMREEILYLLTSLLREVDEQADGCETVCQNLLEVLLIRLVRESTMTAQPIAERPSNKECAAAKRYIDENFAENITLELLAEVAHINKFYLSHTFQREYKTSPINYLIHKRIAESKALLTQTDLSLANISSNMGFSSSSYFSQSFRQLEGISPSQYRKRMQNP